MTNEPEFDPNLWFTQDDCEGKHYLLGNPHTFNGRMLAWCPVKKTSFFVSIAGMETMSEQAKYWVQGFLNGNQPEPPSDEQGDVDFDSPEYKKWVDEVELFLATGYWNTMERFCESCGNQLMFAEPKEVCANCKT